MQISNMVITFWFRPLKQKSISAVLLSFIDILETGLSPFIKNRNVLACSADVIQACRRELAHDCCVSAPMIGLTDRDREHAHAYKEWRCG
jgi:hypothetical protein